MTRWPASTGRVLATLLAVAFAAGCAQSPEIPEGESATRSTGRPEPDPRSATPPADAPVVAQPPATPPLVEPAVPTVAMQALTNALSVVGSPYRYGGTAPTGFDCSGLVRYSFGLAGVDLPRATREQRQATRRLGAAESMAPGDLVFFTRGKSALHVGIVAGDGRFVHAASQGGGVRVEALAAPHWQRRFIEVRRVDPDSWRAAAR